ncbi:glycosyltransferase [Phormidium pseudopriestleyi FRX01]|uniref:Glycosyltransferase n=1 Tax=Phormidium pseudopriestleyi FRX01 TaxID=1759528 RepID=A0ABS3FQT7_9CYAN|nr:glycosyltransferase [Phormidium pseudopriestleyi]MBO0349486.1 glycosyltransferase [Phormidium pseudopriestleyi FRX01]
MAVISVIIPAYNAENTIKDTINSVLQQTFSDLELIVINDGSTDTTLEIISHSPDPRIQVFSYPNSGASTSRNRGFAQASGEYIAFLDADDLWTPDKLEAQLTALKTHPQADIAYSWSDCIDESSRFLRRGGHITINGDGLPKLLMMDILENGSNPLIRRQALIEVGGFDESLPAGQDWDFYLRLAVKHSFVTVPRSQVLYRISANSLSANVFKLETGCLRVLDRAYRQAPESLQHLKPYSLGNLYKYLTFKALEGNPKRLKAIAALRFLSQAIRYDPVLLRKKVIFKVLFKVFVIALLPPAQAGTFITKMKGLANPITLLGYVHLDAV